MELLLGFVDSSYSIILQIYYNILTEAIRTIIKFGDERKDKCFRISRKILQMGIKKDWLSHDNQSPLLTLNLIPWKTQCKYIASRWSVQMN